MTDYKLVPVELKELLASMVKLHESKGTVLTVHMHQLREMLAAGAAVQGELVGYVRPHHLEMLRSGKVCGITMEDRPDERNGVTVPLYAAQQPAPDVTALVEALEEAYGTLERAVSPADETPEAAIQIAMFVIDAALAAHRKGGE